MSIIQKAYTVLRDPRIVPRKLLNFLWSLPMSGQVTRGGEFYSTPRHMNPIDRRNLFMNRYEAEERVLLEKFRKVDVIIEVGANIGFVARHAFARLNEGGLYICVEPNPLSQVALAKNMKATQKHYPGRDYKIIAAAVCGADGGSARFGIKPNLSSAFLDDMISQAGVQKIIDVPLRSLSGLVREFVPKGKTVSLICDAEGAEVSMLAEDAGAFRHFQGIAIELHETDGIVMPANMQQSIQALGFELVTSGRDQTCCLFRNSISHNTHQEKHALAAAHS